MHLDPLPKGVVKGSDKITPVGIAKVYIPEMYDIEASLFFEVTKA